MCLCVFRHGSFLLTRASRELGLVLWYLESLATMMIEVKNTFAELCALPDPDEGHIKRQQSDSVLDAKAWRSLYNEEVDPCRADLGSRCVHDGPDAVYNKERILSDDGFHPVVSKRVDGHMVLGGCTTVMLKNIPLKYSQWSLLMIVNRIGFLGSFDYFYVPMVAKRGENRGYAFINASCRKAACALQTSEQMQYIDNLH